MLIFLVDRYNNSSTLLPIGLWNPLRKMVEHGNLSFVQNRIKKVLSWAIESEGSIEKKELITLSVS